MDQRGELRPVQYSEQGQPARFGKRSGHALTQLGESCLHAGRTSESVRHFGDALQLWRGLGDQWGERRSLAGLAEAGASR